MSLIGVSGPRTGSLTIRKGNGTVSVEGDPPDAHTFPRKFLDRELNQAVRVHIVLQSNPPVVYELVGFEGADWVAHRLNEPQAPAQEPTRRRWFRRRK